MDSQNFRGIFRKCGVCHRNSAAPNNNESYYEIMRNTISLISRRAMLFAKRGSCDHGTAITIVIIKLK